DELDNDRKAENRQNKRDDQVENVLRIATERRNSRAHALRQSRIGRSRRREQHSTQRRFLRAVQLRNKLLPHKKHAYRREIQRSGPRHAPDSDMLKKTPNGMEHEPQAIAGKEGGQPIADENREIAERHRCCPAIKPSAKHTTSRSAGTSCIASSAVHIETPHSKSPLSGGERGA